MNLDVAIQFEKYNLGNDIYAFKPIGTIVGKYDEAFDQFETNFGSTFSSITDPYIETNSYFYFPTNIKKLKSELSQNENPKALFQEFFDICQDNIYIGVFDYNVGEMNILQIPQIQLESFSGIEMNEEPGVILSVSELDKLLKLKSLSEVRNALNDYITIAKEDEQEEIKESESYKVDKKASKKMTLAKLRKKVNSIIIDQDKAVNDVTRAIIVNETSTNPSHKSHVLVMGPSGTGKTKMVDVIAKEMGLPYFKADATAYTKEGYVGKSVYSMLEGLLAAANNDIEQAQRGILVVDEIDKKLLGREDDVGGQAVLHSLLKIMDREIIELDIGPSFDARKVMFDTSNLTIIFMGAFEDFYRNKKENKKAPIGFGAVEKVPEVESFEVTRQELIDYGVPSEFLGRIGVLTSTNKLSKKSLINILNRSKESPLKEEIEYFKNLGTTITFSKGFKLTIADRAIKANTGARNLRSEVKGALIDVYDNVLSGKKPKQIRIIKDTVHNPKKYYTK